MSFIIKNSFTIGELCMAEKNPERLKILEKINEYEKTGRFNDDVEQDAPGHELKPQNIDYCRYGFFAHWKAKRAIGIARKMVKGLEMAHQFVLKDVKGIENLKGLKTGAIMTSNHFNAFESFAIHLGYEAACGRKRFYRVISEANYTGYTGVFKILMQNADTLPLSSNKRTMHKFLTSLDRILKDGYVVLVYPEQSMWWNYRKPRPFREGAFRFAVKSNVPVIPAFITMEDTEYTDGDGFPVQAYTVHFGKLIYPDPSKDRKENIEYMSKENFKFCKEVYEEFYKEPLKYLCDN